MLKFVISYQMFIITERQYNIIMKQCQAGYPQEVGGFLGGHGNKILGVLPVANKNLHNRRQSFALSGEDVERAYHFLVKHRLEFLGVYHSHPSGAPHPSAQDLSHGLKYLFIISLQNRYNPELYAWRVEGQKVYAEDIKIISDAGITVIDIRSGQPKLADHASPQTMDRLAHLIDDLIAGRHPSYERQKSSPWDPSTFSTLA